MVTNEFDALTLVLSSSYRCQESGLGRVTMEETVSGKLPQIVTLKSDYKGVDGFALYRLEDKGTNLLQPFLNHNNDDVGVERKSPKYLVSMCDYLSVCSFNDKTYVFLFELKRGESGDYQKQLEAGESLFRYICNSIDRIKAYDGISFDRDLISVKKFLVKQSRSNKQDITPALAVKGIGGYYKVETFNELGLLKLIHCK